MTLKTASVVLFRKSKTVLDYLATVLVVVTAAIVLWRVVRGPERLAADNGPTKAAKTKAAMPLPKEPLSLAGAALHGDARAKVAIVEFSDFQCPYCARFAAETLPVFLEKYVRTGRVLFAFRHLPLRMHSAAQKAAETAECARRQERFWPMHDRLFLSQPKLTTMNWLEEATAIGLDSKKFRTCLDGQAIEAVRNDQQTARALGIAGTPTFLLGTKEADGRIKIVDRLGGALTMESLEKAVAPLLGLKSSS